MRPGITFGCCALLLAAAAGSSQNRRTENEVETVADTEKRIKKIVNYGFKLALPYLITGATEIRINTKCMQGLFLTLRGVMDIKDWAVKMVDAMGKPSAGLLEGTALMMGDYDECLEVRAPRRMRPVPRPPFQPHQVAFHGQYCVVKIHLPEGIRRAAMDYQTGNRTHSDLANSNTFLRNLVKLAPRADIADFRLGICVPSVCNETDIQTIVDQVTGMVKMEATVMRCQVEAERKYETIQILVICAIGLVALLTVIGTSTHIFIRFTRNVPVNISFESKSVWIRCLMAFSLSKNTGKLLSLKSNDSPQISCLRGMKFMSVCLYIVVWTYATPQDFHFFKYRSAFHFYKFMEEWWFTVFANASAGIDSFFLIAGLQISYRMWWKSKQGDNRGNVFKFILKWYSRLALSQLLVIGLFLCLPLMGNGPLWGDIVTPAVENCKERWWLNILGINNFWPSNLTCLPHSWLLCALLHLMLIAPFLLLILKKSTSLGILVNMLIILGSSIAIALVTLSNELPPAPAFYFLSFVNVKVIWHKLFIQAYDHAAPFCIGILLGFFLNKHKEVKLKKTTVVACWCGAVALNMTVMCGLYGYRHGEEMKMSLSALYASVHRVCWSIGIAWIVFACAYGYGGFVQRILSWELFIICDRLSNLVYLMHPLVFFLHEGQLRVKMYMAHLDQAMYAVAYIVFTLAVTALCYVMCIAPFCFFEKMLWCKKKTVEEFTKEKSAKQLDTNSMTVSTDIELPKNKLNYLPYTIDLNSRKEIDGVFKL